MRVLALLLLCGCGAESVASLESEQSITVACVPTSYDRPPGDCARQTICDDGTTCPPHIGFRCAGSGQCVGSAQRCDDLDAGTAVTCR